MEQRNKDHASTNVTIKKLMEEKKVSLSDSIFKAATWTHNISINKLGFLPLQLVTGKAVTIPGLTTGNIVTKSMMNYEAFQRTMENFTKIISKLRKSHMQRKLKEYQGVQIKLCQH